MLEFFKKFEYVFSARRIFKFNKNKKFREKGYKYDQEVSPNTVDVDHYNKKIDVIESLQNFDVNGLNLIEFGKNLNLKEISLLIQTHDAPVKRIFIEDTFNKISIEKFFSQKLLTNVGIEKLTEVKKIQIENLVTILDHIFIKICDKDFVVLFTLTKGLFYKNLYILETEKDISAIDFYCHKNFVHQYESILGFGHIYTREFFEKNDILKFSYSQNIHREFMLYPKLDEVKSPYATNYQVRKFTEFMDKINPSNDYDLNIPKWLEKEISKHRYINVNNNLYIKDQKGVLCKVNNNTTAHANPWNSEIFDKIKDKIE